MRCHAITVCFQYSVAQSKGMKKDKQLKRREIRIGNHLP